MNVKKDDLIRLKHMLEAARDILAFTEGETRESFKGDRKLNLAVVRLIEIIGEAAARLTDDIKGQYTNVPWKVIIGMRNRLIHAYFDVDLDRVWDTVVVSIPELHTQIKKLLSEIEDSTTNTD